MKLRTMVALLSAAGLLAIAAPDRAFAQVDRERAKPQSRPDATDAGITSKIEIRLKSDGALKGHDIDVDTKDGVVTLSGEVGSSSVRKRALAIASDTTGVKSVVDRLEVAGAGADQRAAEKDADGNPISDGWITAKVSSQFVPEDALDDSHIDVDTSHGVVTLSGTVRSSAGKAKAEQIAKATDGVKSVKNALVVQPKK
jgi:hyperosmotically inducible protein